MTSKYDETVGAVGADVGEDLAGECRSECGSAPAVSANTMSPVCQVTPPISTGAPYRTRWYGPCAGATPVDQTGMPDWRTGSGFWTATLETTPDTPSRLSVRVCMLPSAAARPARSSTSIITAIFGRRDSTRSTRSSRGS